MEPWMLFYIGDDKYEVPTPDIDTEIYLAMRKWESVEELVGWMRKFIRENMRRR